MSEALRDPAKSYLKAEFELRNWSLELATAGLQVDFDSVSYFVYSEIFRNSIRAWDCSIFVNMLKAIFKRSCNTSGAWTSVFVVLELRSSLVLKLKLAYSSMPPLESILYVYFKLFWSLLIRFPIMTLGVFKFEMTVEFSPISFWNCLLDGSLGYSSKKLPKSAYSS